jgi:hypothetical protein
MSGHSLWNLAQEPGMSSVTGDFDGKIDFDILHFTNSANASPLIVQSFYDSNKIYNPQF